MIPRLAEKALEKLARSFPVVAITGPRQSGKTTLAKLVFQHKPYVSLENPDTLDHALNDPRDFLASYQQGAVFDEVQRAPQLFSYLQEIVDASNKTGRFIVTGSCQFSLVAKITQSLAGRIGFLQLLPFSLAELKNSWKPKTCDMLFYGLYPALHDRNIEPQLYYPNYVQTYLEKDLRLLQNIQNLAAFRLFLRLCAARTGQVLNMSSIGNDCGVNRNTVRGWLSVLQASFLLHLLQPHHENFRKRMIKAPKLYFFDTGLACSLLGIQSADQLSNHPLKGALFETWVVSELFKQRFNCGLPSNLYYWRDRTGNEIDLIIDQGLKLWGLEIKSAKTVTGDFFKNIHRWKEIAGERVEKCFLIYDGERSQLRSQFIHVLPAKKITLLLNKI
ncbi:ATP-binding protein [Candidatus Riflebacteria bacterium]